MNKRAQANDTLPDSRKSFIKACGEHRRAYALHHISLYGFVGLGIRTVRNSRTRCDDMTDVNPLEIKNKFTLRAINV